MQAQFILTQRQTLLPKMELQSTLLELEQKEQCRLNMLILIPAKFILAITILNLIRLLSKKLLLLVAEHILELNRLRLLRRLLILSAESKMSCRLFTTNLQTGSFIHIF